MVYPALVGFLNSLESYSSDLVQELRAGVKLCHYTTLDGAIGIVQGGDLWLSHLRFSTSAASARRTTCSASGAVMPTTAAA